MGDKILDSGDPRSIMITKPHTNNRHADIVVDGELSIQLHFELGLCMCHFWSEIRFDLNYYFNLNSHELVDTNKNRDIFFVK